MSNKEINDFLRLLEKEKKKAAKDTKEEAEAFLKRIGVLTKNGNVAMPYNQLWKLKAQG